MEASPFSFAPERYWTEEKERALIDFFSKHSCLWNHKSENYKNRQLRWKTLDHLTILLSAHPPPVRFAVEDIKNKFKNLRTTFQRQYKMVRASKACGSDDVFVPQWKHYQQLMFLQGCWDGEDDPELSPPPPPAPDEDTAKPGLAFSGPVISFVHSQATSTSTPTPASCAPSHIMARTYWSEEKERALISFYSDHGCLWNKRSENHNNRQLRLRLLETLRSQLSDHLLSLSVDDLKAKFKNLRTVFNREYKAVQAGRQSDKPYVSKWKHYHHMLFLCESCDEDDCQEDLLHVPVPQEDKDLPERGDQTPSSSVSSFSSGSAQNIKFNNSPVPSSDAKAAYQISLPASPPDHLKLLADQIAAAPTLPPAPASPPTSLPDIKPCVNPSPLNVIVSGSLQPDGRLSADSRGHWSEAKVQQLISFYSEHSCLWNHKSESYRNRLLRQSLLEKLSSVLSYNEPVPFTVEDIKTKFRNLRTIFQREHKAASSNKTCGSEDFYLPKWKHYRELMFLCDSCDEDDRPRDPHLSGPHESGPTHPDTQTLPPYASQYHASTQTAAPKLSITSPPSPTPPDSQLSSPSSSPPSTSSSFHADSRAFGRKRASGRPPAPISGDVMDLVRTLCQNRIPQTQTTLHTGFLKYVEECLNETPPDKVKRLKKKIIETIHSVSEEV